MNTPTMYQRQLDRTLPEPSASFENQPGDPVDALAVHRDPSVREEPSASEEVAPQRGVAWVRPSELPSLLGSKVAGRGIDLQTELARRARQTPARTAATVSRRITRGQIARPEPTSRGTVDREGLGL